MQPGGTGKWMPPVTVGGGDGHVFSPPLSQGRGFCEQIHSLLRNPGELGQLVTHALVHRVRHLLMTLSPSARPSLPLPGIRFLNKVFPSKPVSALPLGYVYGEVSLCVFVWVLKGELAE